VVACGVERPEGRGEWARREAQTSTAHSPATHAVYNPGAISGAGTAGSKLGRAARIAGCSAAWQRWEQRMQECSPAGPKNDTHAGECARPSPGNWHSYGHGCKAKGTKRMCSMCVWSVQLWCLEESEEKEENANTHNPGLPPQRWRVADAGSGPACTAEVVVCSVLHPAQPPLQFSPFFRCLCLCAREAPIFYTSAHIDHLEVSRDSRCQSLGAGPWLVLWNLPGTIRDLRPAECAPCPKLGQLSQFTSSLLEGPSRGSCRLRLADILQESHKNLTSS
jgi:hypothetical protein